MRARAGAKRARVAGAALAALCACAHATGPVDVRFQIAGARDVVIRAEVADTPAERARGLMGRRHLPPDQGMLFVFRDVAVRHFTMKDTLIPLDLVSIRAGRVVGVQRMVPCPAMPCPLTDTPPVDAALELNAGASERVGIAVGVIVDAPGLR